MPDRASHPGSADRPAGPPAQPRAVDHRSARGFLAGMRIRKKLIVLHTCFSLGLALILLVLLRPATREIVERAEASEARVLLATLLEAGALDAFEAGPSATGQGATGSASTGRDGEHARLIAGSAEALGIGDHLAAEAMARPGEPIDGPVVGGAARAIAYVPGRDGGEFVGAIVRIPESRRAVVLLYGLLTAALLAVYALVAVALEVFVLPRHVYAPIRRMLEADRAVQEGRRDAETIPAWAIPADELGEIMRSRNESVAALRRHERALADALAQLERVAADLARKNHLLENARRNLADADRLASLGMMSAGIAHELNTPLTVLKGLVERLHRDPAGGVDARTAELMLRVVRRLERLGDSLLDFARARPPRTRPVPLAAATDEAMTLVRLDREARGVTLENRVPADLMVEGDPDRLVQVLVNLVRNAVDAVREQAGTPAGLVTAAASVFERDGAAWASVTITDDGPGLDADLLPRLFEPFASTRLDSKGTGLGLAVADGIVREHGGAIIARNRVEHRGAVFEVLIPMTRSVAGEGGAPGDETAERSGIAGPTAAVAGAGPGSPAF